MKQATIKITVKFGSKFQEQFARDSLFASLKVWQQFLINQHKENDISVVINGDSIKNLEWFDWKNCKKES